MGKTAAQLESNRQYMQRWREANREKSREKDREWYRANKEKRRDGNRRWRAANPVKHRAQGRKARTGFTQTDWDARLVEQGGLCAICRDRVATDADHNHTTGQKRGLLCRRCNVTLGLYEASNRERFDSYLSEWNGRRNSDS